MARIRIEKSDFHNPSSETIVFEIGTTPNDCVEQITVRPGETFKGYPDYTKVYKRKGLVPGPAPGAAEVLDEASVASKLAAEAKESAVREQAEAAKMKAEAAQAKADAEVEMAEARAAEAKAANSPAIPVSSPPLIEPVKTKPVAAKAKKASKG